MTTKTHVLANTEDRIQDMAISDILRVLTDFMFWENEGPGFTCTEAEALAAAAVFLGADLTTMAALVVDGHGQPGRSEDEGDLHYHREDE